MQLIPVRIEGFWGYRDLQNGDFVIKPVYDAANEFSEGLALVSIYKNESHHWGYIDEKGIVVIPLKYQNADNFINGFARAKSQGKWGIINKNGNAVIPFEYDWLDAPQEELVRVQEKSKWGFVNTKNEIVAQTIYDNIPCNFKNGFAWVENNGKWGLLDRTGKEIIPLIYEELFWIGAERIAAKQDGKYAMLLTDGVMLTGFVYDELRPLYDNQIACVERDGLYGFINSKGEEVIKPQYDLAFDFGDGSASPFDCDMAYVSANGKFFYINMEGKVLTEDQSTPIDGFIVSFRRF